MSVITIPARTARWLKAFVVVAMGIGMLVAVDTAVAMRAEHHLAQNVKDASNLDNTPQVYLGGLPYSAAAVTHELPLIEINAFDMEVPRLGLVSASTTLRDVTVTPAQVFAGDFDGAPVSTFSRSISLDGVSLGRLLGISDLSIANPEDISPGGGMSTEAELTGTLPGAREKSEVHVTLRLDGPHFHMTPTNARTDAERKAFTYELDTRQLPLSAQATAVRLAGAKITFETQRRNITVKNSQLSPLEVDLNFDSEGKEY